MEAVGTLETMGLVPALVAADAACKAAGVTIAERLHIKGSPLVCIVFHGELAAMQTALAAGAAAARQVGELLAQNIIARPVSGLEQVWQKSRTGA